MLNHVLERPRLFAALDDRATRLVVLSAPSGFGKSTLVRSWVDRQPTRALWVPLNAEVPTLAAFWQTVALSARRAGLLDEVSYMSLVSEIEASAHPRDVVARALADDDLVLVLDAYEHARGLGEDVDEDVLLFVAENPRTRVMVTTRSETGLVQPVHQLRLAVSVIGSEDLAFTLAETGQLATSYAATTAAEQLQDETRGYPLALRAALLSGSVPVAEADRSWRALVAEDLRRSLPPELAPFLEATSVPPYFDADLARVLTGREDALDVLEQLERSGVGRWIPFAAGRPAFQYVDAFREGILEEQLRMAPERYAASAAATARWLQAEGEYQSALTMAVAARRWDLASSVFLSLLFARPETYTTDDLATELAQVPAADLRRYPVLALARAVTALSNPATRGAAPEYLAIVADRATHDLSGLSRVEVLVHHTMKVFALRMLGRSAESGQHARRALAFHDEHVASDDHPALVEMRPFLLRHLAYSLLQIGDISAAAEVVTRAGQAATQPWSRNYTLTYAVGIHAIDGRRPTAVETQRLIDPSAWPRDHQRSYLNALGKVGEAALLLDQFEFAAALEVYNDCESFLSTAEFWPYITWTLMMARLGLGEAATEAHRVDELLATPPTPPGVGPNLGTSLLRGTLAGLWIAAGRRTDASALLGAKDPYPGQLAPSTFLLRMLADPGKAVLTLPRLEAARGHTIRSRMALLTLGAAAAMRANLEDTAIGLLGRATALFESYGPRAQLLWVPGDDLVALRGVAAEHLPASASTYLAAPVPTIIEGTPAGAASLTGRELAVLRAWAEHPSRAAVASALHVSENTVKTQLQSLYRKLEVNSRDGVLQRAAEQGLLGRTELG